MLICDSFFTFRITCALFFKLFRIKIIATEPGTIVTINNRQQFVMTNAGDFLEWPLREFTQITTTQPVMIAQIASNKRLFGNEVGPFMFVLAPVEQWKDEYLISPPRDEGYSHSVCFSLLSIYMSFYFK